MWYYIIKEREREQRPKEILQKEILIRNCSYQLSECILRVKTIGLLKCRYFSSKEGEIPWQVKNHSTYAVRIASWSSRCKKKGCLDQKDWSHTKEMRNKMRQTGKWSAVWRMWLYQQKIRIGSIGEIPNTRWWRSCIFGESLENRCRNENSKSKGMILMMRRTYLCLQLTK